MREGEQPRAERLHAEAGADEGEAYAQRGQQNERSERYEKSGEKQQTGGQPQNGLLGADLQ